ncbi:MAG TPA: malate synthase G [Allosphingosinicella sp.]
MAEYELISGIEVDPRLRAFIEEEALPGTGIGPADFWFGFSALLRELTPENRRLLRRREDLQALIDERNASLGGRPAHPAHEEEFLRDIGYLVDPPAPFTIGTENVDPEISKIAGPQLVVPVSNARYALNAANARWGSLYDALYGTDVLGDRPAGGGYDPERGQRVVEWARTFLDEVLPLTGGSSWAALDTPEDAEIFLDGRVAEAVGRRRTGEDGWAMLFRRNGLHIEVVIDWDHPIGRTDKAGIADVILESAVTAIMDCEDSVAAVDAAEKVVVYRNWLGLMKGDLATRFDKQGESVARRLEPDREYDLGSGQTLALKGRALMFVRNVGHLMANPMMRIDGEDVQEGLADAVITSLAALHDLRGARSNSPAGSIYIVKPKMHGPEEAAFAGRLFDRTEDLLGLPRHTIKIGVMDEERRTSVNLAAVIHAVRDRIVFINTGFLDRTGDEIHTAMKLGPVIRKAEMKSSEWLKTYEDNNVDVGLACGFAGRAQIGKGMWAMPDLMAAMLDQKIAHPNAGASTAWVPSPTAATLHAVHYHRVDVAQRQRELAGRPAASLHGLLTVPVAAERDWTPEAISEELENNVQGILGYVVRWIDQGVGCSKVPDVHDVGLMEDRATCRISSQHVANWLMHGIVGDEQVDAALARMAAVVDRQNRDDPGYRPMAPDLQGNAAFRAARALVFEGARQPSGYTEPILHGARLAVLAAER